MGRVSQAANVVKIVEKTRLQPPAHLTARAAEAWIELVSSLPANAFAASDRHLLEMWAESVAKHRLCMEVIEKEGIVVIGKDGQTVKHPLLDVAEKQARLVNGLAARLRIGPSTRETRDTRSRQAKSSPANDFDGIIG